MSELLRRQYDEMVAENARLAADLEAMREQRDAALAESERLRAVGNALADSGTRLRRYIVKDKRGKRLQEDEFFDNLESGLQAANDNREAEKAWHALADARQGGAS